MSPAALSYESLEVRHRPQAEPVLAGLDLELAAGERLALLGLNGAGKTSLLMATVGLLPHRGRIRVAGVELGPASLAEVRSRVGFLFNVPEDQLLFPRVIDDVAFGLLGRGLPADQAESRARAALDRLDAAALAERPVHALSHGQKLRVALAGALATQPEVLLLDEPSAGLDPPGRRRLAGHLAGSVATLLLATHDLAFAAGCCTRWVLLEGGRVARTGRDFEEIDRLWAPETAQG